MFAGRREKAENGADKLNFKYWYLIKMQSCFQRAKGMAMNKVLVWALVLAIMTAGGQAYAADNIDGLINGLFCKDEQGVHVCADFVPTDGIFYYGTYPNGKLIGKGYAKGGKIDGPVEIYYENGKLGSVANYKDGKLDGSAKSYYENGKLQEEMTFKDGKPEGGFKRYYESGQLEEETNYKDGKPEGVSKMYHKNGQLVTEECFM